jgi:hypothetical protein
LQTVTDFGEFSRRCVNALLLSLRALLLAVSTRLLAVSTLAKRLELVRHLLDGSSEISQLASDDRCVLLGTLEGSHQRLVQSVIRVRQVS